MYVNEWWRGCLRAMLPLVPLAAMAIPAHAQSFDPLNPPLGCPSGSSPACVNQDPPGLADTAEPGAVLIFPKFAQGSLTLDSGAIVPRTQIEIGAVCPNSLSTPIADSTSPVTCNNRNYFVEVHWVCPGAPAGQENSVCSENDFQIEVSTYGKVAFNPSGLTPSAAAGAGGPVVTGYSRAKGGASLGGTDPVPSSTCQRGYAIAYLIDNQFDLAPVAGNVLIGDAVMRNFASGLDLQSYSALAIQSLDNVPSGTAALIPINVVPDPSNTTGHGSALPFDGQPHHYQMVTGQFWGDVRFNSDTAAPFSDTTLILLTLDVRSNLQNHDTNVQLDFWNANEANFSTPGVTFACWTQVDLVANIDPNLTAATVGTPNGLVVSGQATDAVTGAWRTLLALIQTTEGNPGGVAKATRSYTARPSNNSVPVATYFVYN